MKKFTLNRDPEIKINELKRSGVHFIVSRTQSSCKITIPSRGEVYFKGNSDYTFAEMRNQKALKKAVHENIIEKGLVVPIFSPKDIKYHQYSNYVLNELQEGVKLFDFIEFDITKAYYKVAFNLGYINYDMYLQFINLPKNVRLRFLGSIATKKRRYFYSEGQMTSDPEVLEDTLLRQVWFHICKVTDDCLSEFMNLAGDNFLLYYVDGIYLKKANYTKLVNKISKKYKVEFKEEKVESIVRTYDPNAKCFKITITKWSDKKKKFVPKDFMLKSQKDPQNGEYKQLLKENNITE